MVSFRRTVGLFFLATVLLCSPRLAYAQFVPVLDVTLVGAFNGYLTMFGNFQASFNAYVNDFNASISLNTDSVRNLIGGANPGGIANAPCVMSDADDSVYAGDPATPGTSPDEYYGTHDAEAYSNQNWASASAASNNTIPLEIPGPTSLTRARGHTVPQVNTSRSLRCLLQELVEWKKLDLSIQLHELLKNYISNAQTKQLSNQFISKMTAGNMNFLKQTYQSYNNGVVTTAPGFMTNPDEYEADTADREVRFYVRQMTAPAGAPIGQLPMCNYTRIAAAKTVLAATESVTVNSYKMMDRDTRCTATDPGNGIVAAEPDLQVCLENPSDPRCSGGDRRNTIDFLLTNSRANSPLGSMDLAADNASLLAMKAQRNLIKDADRGGGYIATVDCLNDPAVNPECAERYKTRTTAPSGNRAMGDEATLSSGDAAERADEPDAVAQRPVLETTVETAQYSGFYGVNTIGLANAGTAVHDLVKELYDTIWMGYFDLHPYTAEWAQATMLMIYDEMKFAGVNGQVRPGGQVITSEEPLNAGSNPSGNSVIQPDWI